VNESEGISAGFTYLSERWDQTRQERSRPMKEQNDQNKKTPRYTQINQIIQYA
jgi:hypothetical protein